MNRFNAKNSGYYFSSTTKLIRRSKKCIAIKADYDKRSNWLSYLINHFISGRKLVGCTIFTFHLNLIFIFTYIFQSNIATYFSHWSILPCIPRTHNAEMSRIGKLNDGYVRVIHPRDRDSLDIYFDVDCHCPRWLESLCDIRLRRVAYTLRAVFIHEIVRSLQRDSWMWTRARYSLDESTNYLSSAISVSRGFSVYRYPYCTFAKASLLLAISSCEAFPWTNVSRN